MATKVVVQDIESLSAYCKQMIVLKNELEQNAQRLSSLSETVRSEAERMNNATASQGSNWHDPQYDRLKTEVAQCTAAINQTAESIRTTAATVKGRMLEVQNAIDYLQVLLRKLRDV